MLKWICIFVLAIQPLCADRGNGRANMDRRQEEYEDEKPTLYDVNQGEFDDSVPNWNRPYNDDENDHDQQSCPGGGCRKHQKLYIEDDYVN